MMALFADMRLGTSAAKTAFLFTRVGLAGCDMGACAVLPRVIGQGRAAELLFTGRSLSGEEAERWGFLNRLGEPEAGRVRRRPRQARRDPPDGGAPWLGPSAPPAPTKGAWNATGAGCTLSASPGDWTGRRLG